MQENRSFDHYFGTLSGVRGFSDPDVLKQTVGGVSYPVFDQFGYQPGAGVDASGYMQPFNLVNDPPAKDGETTNDIAHDWGTQHGSWNNGAMNAFMTGALRRGRRRQRPGHHGLLHVCGTGLLLRAGRRVHDLRRVFLLGADRQGAHPDLPGHVRLGRGLRR